MDTRAATGTGPGQGVLGHAGDRGDIISSWLIKLSISLALVGLVAFDGLSLLSTQVSLTDQAVLSARRGADAVEASQDLRAVYAAIDTAARKEQPANTVAPERVLVRPDGSVTVTVDRTATTLLLQRLGPLADWTERSATATAAPLP